MDKEEDCRREGEGWRVVAKMAGRERGVIRWELQVYPPGEGVGKLVSKFETNSGWRREEFARGLLGCVERLLGVVAPGGLVGAKNE